MFIKLQPFIKITICVSKIYDFKSFSSRSRSQLGFYDFKALVWPATLPSSMMDSEKLLNFSLSWSFFQRMGVTTSLDISELKQEFPCHIFNMVTDRVVLKSTTFLFFSHIIFSFIFLVTYLSMNYFSYFPFYFFITSLLMLSFFFCFVFFLFWYH